MTRRRRIRFLLYAVAGLLLSLLPASAAPERPTLLVFGDSISAAYGLAEHKGWVALLRTRLAEHGFDWRVVNASISGEKTWRGAVRLPPALKRHDPAIVVIQLGINDVMMELPEGIEEPPLEVIRNNLTRMVRQAQSAGARVLVVGVRLPARYGSRYGQRFDDVIREVVDTTGAALVPRVLARVGERDVAERDDLLQPGASVHPTARGHVLILDNVWPVLLRLMVSVQPPTSAEVSGVPRDIGASMGAGELGVTHACNLFPGSSIPDCGFGIRCR
jgi:acyl-CoA thioesterase-1